DAVAAHRRLRAGRARGRRGRRLGGRAGRGRNAALAARGAGGFRRAEGATGGSRRIALLARLDDAVAAEGRRRGRRGARAGGGRARDRRRGGGGRGGRRERRRRGGAAFAVERHAVGLHFVRVERTAKLRARGQLELGLGRADGALHARAPRHAHAVAVGEDLDLAGADGQALGGDAAAVVELDAAEHADDRRGAHDELRVAAQRDVAADRV